MLVRRKLRPHVVYTFNNKVKSNVYEWVAAEYNGLYFKQCRFGIKPMFI